MRAKQLPNMLFLHPMSFSSLDIMSFGFVDHQAGLDPQHGTHRLVTITMCMHARASSQLLREAGRRAEALRAAQLTLHCHLSSTSDRTTWQNQCMTQQSAAVMRSASSEETLLALSLSLVFLHKLGKLVHLLCQLSLHAAMAMRTAVFVLEVTKTQCEAQASQSELQISSSSSSNSHSKDPWSLPFPSFARAAHVHRKARTDLSFQLAFFQRASQQEQLNCVLHALTVLQR